MTGVDVAGPSDRLGLYVHARRMLTASVCEFDLRSVAGALPRFKAGGSLRLRTPSSEWRNYSICNDELEGHRYVIAVKREMGSRGGSRSMHGDAPPGAVLAAGLPEDGLDLAEGRDHFLVAGGIGITPLLCLARKLARERDHRYRLIYLAPSPEEAAYADVLAGSGFEGHVTCHFSSRHAGRRYDLRPSLRDNGGKTHLYYCGPRSMMEGVRLMSIHWPRAMVHSESFGADGGMEVGDEPFKVRQSSTGRIFRVRGDQTVLQSLREGGLSPPAGCESGTCGRCRMALISGEADHRDVHLAPEERGSAFMPCVSRGVDLIELDF